MKPLIHAYITGLTEEDIPYIEPHDSIHLAVSPSILTEFKPAQFALACKRADILIFHVNGAWEFIQFIEKHLLTTSLGAVFASSRAKKIIWSVDTHVMAQLESNISHLDLIDRIYSAHSSFLATFNPEKTRWLPCCYRLGGIDYLKQWLTRPNKPTKNLDLLFYYNPAPSGNRNQLAAQAKCIADEMGLLSLFGHVGEWDEILAAVDRSQACLNLSMMGELNYRFFELLGLGAIQLADISPDATKLTPPSHNLISIQRDLSDFITAIDQALDTQPDNSGPLWILNHHMLIHRIVEIINAELNLSLSIRPTHTL